MSKQSALISIVIPAYNAENYIATAIESITTQTYSNWELIVVDDGSIDKTSEIVKSFKDTRITFVSQNNRGVSFARNIGIDLSKGKYITFLDADDAIPNYSLEERVKFLESSKDIDVVHGIISIIDEELKNEIKSYRPFFYKNVLKNTLHLDKRMVFNPGYMIKKDKLNNIRFQDGMTHSEDTLFLLRLASSGISFGFIPKVMYHYRVTKTSAMSNMIGWRQGYFDLIKNIKDIASISYVDTVIMRIKIAKMLTLWHIRNKNLIGLIDIFKIFK